MSIFDKLEEVVNRYEQVNEKLADPTIFERQTEYRELTTERSNLEEIVTVYKEFKRVKEDIDEAKEILKTEKDQDLRAMAKEELAEKEDLVPEYEDRLKILLLPKDPLDDKNVMVEIRAGAGGDEASIFVGDVLRLYQNYCRDLSFKTDIVSISEGDEGIKEVILSVVGEKVYSKLKYESGVHRVQRVPKTESQGRIHTSTITVAVMPEAEELDFELDMNDVRIDVFRASGAGGQHVNTTDSAIRVTHIPTGTVVANQDQKSQLKNKEKALKILKTRIYDKLVQEKNSKEAEERRGLVGTGDRSERIRTYNYPQGRLTDHRIGLTLYSLERIMEGHLEPVTDALVAHNQAALLKGQEE
jgi:peptide chain release factor 1